MTTPNRTSKLAVALVAAGLSLTGCADDAEATPPGSTTGERAPEFAPDEVQEQVTSPAPTRTPTPAQTPTQTPAPVPTPTRGPTMDAGATPSSAPVVDECSQVGPVPDAVRKERNLAQFYQKYANAGGIPILSSTKPPDKTLTLACQLVNEMVGDRPDVRAALIRNKVHFTMIAATEKTTDPPEFSYLPDYYNTRARGLGGKVGMCAEESILCDRAKDRWYGESICVHEFSHTIAMYGLYTADRTFESRLTAAFREAKAAGKWASTYAGEQPQEYWAEGVQNWYNTNLESARPNGVHGPINTKDELKEYDRKLYDLVDELLPETVKWADCYRRK